MQKANQASWFTISAPCRLSRRGIRFHSRPYSLSTSTIPSQRLRSTGSAWKHELNFSDTPLVALAVEQKGVDTIPTHHHHKITLSWSLTRPPPIDSWRSYLNKDSQCGSKGAGRE
ncbi:uncharacterized protein MYCFIDRAFT_211978 [Pseudocercospora fijiensis CIRAD86]|uniref:Uncharacterized protein n=1 Tax=Pseudocercospora fijiensis (strain CIRAD86) TaxID=383855 RepID=M3ARR5_PSEFD|nr:uncharacterized protein MYCFIDRAFT_211978 [Pseudocercospora fijiensis CIRAD86]EME80142.1 hypothetical protein MYCFIDRAFT_211978 [Pseudocercospora fijiensis CIRAD86]